VEIRTVEASMHGSLDRSDQSRNRTGRSWSIEFFVLPVLVAIGLIAALAIRKPVVSAWISDAARAEFVGLNSPGVVPAESAQPDMQIRTVTAY
jgi:hypothetical protein